MENRTCPQCKGTYPLTDFEGLPQDVRCNRCIPRDEALKLYDRKVQAAGQKLTQIMDSAQGAKSLKPVERLLSEAYDAWGGPGAFAGDVVGWIKDLANMAGGKGKSAAVSASIKLLQLHARIDKMKVEDDWRKMDDATLRETIKIKMLALFAEATADDAKRDTLSLIINA